MTREEYPLRAALELRERELDAAKAALAAARHAEVAQEALLEAAEGNVRSHAALIMSTRAAQKHRGPARAAELGREMDYDLRLRTVRAELATAAETQREHLAEAKKQVATRMNELARARADHEAVLKHQARWRAEQATIAERRAEAEDDDQNSVRFGRK